jgi:hypothetical protein
LLPETIASCYWRPRYQIPTAFRTAPGFNYLPIVPPPEFFMQLSLPPVLALSHSAIVL